MSWRAPLVALLVAVFLGACTGLEAPSFEAETEPLAGGTRDPSVTVDSGRPDVIVESPFQCGGVECPTSSFEAAGVPEQCCTNDGACGFRHSGLGPGCHEADQRGTEDRGCPRADFAVFPFSGCCRDNGRCGLYDTHIGLGCFDPKSIAGGLLSVEAFAQLSCPRAPPSCDPDEADPSSCTACLKRHCCTAWVACQDDLYCLSGWEPLLECLRTSPASGCGQNSLAAELVSCGVLWMQPVGSPDPLLPTPRDAGDADAGDGGPGPRFPCAEACLGG